MFADRRAAGRQLSERLEHLRPDNPLVLALPRGGVPVGFEIAERLDAPLDIVLVRKIGVPWQPELALGAVVDGADPQVLINDDLAAELAIDENYITSETARQLQEIERRRKIYLGDRASIPLAGRTVIIVDDGIATGSTVRAALCAARKAGAGKIVLAVPVAPEDTLERLRARGGRDRLPRLAKPVHRRRRPLRRVSAACRRRCRQLVGGAVPRDDALMIADIGEASRWMKRSVLRLFVERPVVPDGRRPPRSRTRPDHRTGVRSCRRLVSWGSYLEVLLVPLRPDNLIGDFRNRAEIYGGGHVEAVARLLCERKGLPARPSQPNRQRERTAGRSEPEPSFDNANRCRLPKINLNRS